MNRFLLSIMFLLLLCSNYSYAECITNQDKSLNAIAWLYKAMAATYQLNFKTNKDDYIRQASKYYTPAMWGKTYAQLEQQKVFENIINRKGILTLAVNETPYANPVSNGWNILIKLQNRIILADHVEDFLPFRVLNIHIIQDKNNCYLIDSVTPLL